MLYYSNIIVKHFRITYLKIQKNAKTIVFFVSARGQGFGHASSRKMATPSRDFAGNKLSAPCYEVAVRGSLSALAWPRGVRYAHTSLRLSNP